MPSSNTAVTLLGALLLAGCLPTDDRPSPGRAVLQASADPEALEAILTDDGWTIELDRLLLAIGNARLVREPNCKSYEEFFYSRILDLLRPEPQTVSTQFGLGACAVAFELTGVRDDTELVTDVSEPLEELMRHGGSDAIVRGGPVVLHIAGMASRSGGAIAFTWSFRRAFLLEGCAPVHLARGRPRTVDIVLSPGALFQGDVETEPRALRFDPYAEANADGDGTLTLEELSAALVDRLYERFISAMLQIDGQAPCSVERL